MFGSQKILLNTGMIPQTQPALEGWSPSTNTLQQMKIQKHIPVFGNLDLQDFNKSLDGKEHILYALLH